MKKILRVFIFLIIAIPIFYLVPTRDLDVKFISQYPNMPNGCEITSLDMVIRYNGFDVSKEYLNDNFLRKTNTSNANPDKGYIGNPYSESGCYCYAEPIVVCANEYFKEVSSSKRAKNTTGMGVFGILNKVIFKKQPVIVWYTIDDKKPRYSNAYYKNEYQEKIPLYNNLHCVVVDGVSNGKIKIVDPIKGPREINILKFTNIYYRMGKKSLVI